VSRQKTPAKKAAKSKTPAKKGVLVFAVQRVAMGGEGPADGEPERVFADEKAARRYARERSRECRAYTNPFAWGWWEAVAGDEKKLLAVVKKLKLTPPAKKKNEYAIDWSGWWDRTYPDMTDAQRDAVWDALDRLQLYRVVRTTLEG
jgi:hypothetical protein